jgi:uncharacterized protein
MKKLLTKYEGPTALIYCAVVLTLMEYLLIPPRAEAWLSGPGIYGWQQPSLDAGLVWVASCLLFFLAIPGFLISKFDSFKNFGWNPKGFLEHLKVYLLVFLAMTPLIYWASTRPDFSQLYPFIPDARFSMQSFFLWEIAYVLQFFALESFFRGYLLFTLSKYTDKWVAIAAMTVPYAMIHFHKPMPEALGAIIAGLILGHLSLKYRSWLGGAVLHSLVAVTMDTLSVFRG